MCPNGTAKRLGMVGHYSRLVVDAIIAAAVWRYMHAVRICKEASF